MYIYRNYNKANGIYSYGVVGIRDNITEYIGYDIKRITGELQDAVKAVEYDLKKIYINKYN